MYVCERVEERTEVGVRVVEACMEVGVRVIEARMGVGARVVGECMRERGTVVVITPAK